MWLFVFARENRRWIDELTIFLRDTILHIEDKETLFANFLKWLKPGGKLMISGGFHDAFSLADKVWGRIGLVHIKIEPTYETILRLLLHTRWMVTWLCCICETERISSSLCCQLWWVMIFTVNDLQPTNCWPYMTFLPTWPHLTYEFLYNF